MDTTLAIGYCFRVNSLYRTSILQSVPLALLMACSCVSDQTGGRDCEPLLGLKKHRCNGAPDDGLCPEGTMCRMRRECVPIGCNQDPICRARPDTQTCRFSAWWKGPFAGDENHIFTATARYDHSALSPRLFFDNEEQQAGANWVLPQGMDVPIKDGQTVQVEACRAGLGPNEAWAISIRDTEGILLLAGGHGMRILDTPCLTKLLGRSRREMGCTPWFSEMGIGDDGPHMENLAVAMGGKLVGIGDQLSFTLNGRPVKAIVCDARYPIEWNATDVNAPHEGLAIMATLSH